MRRDVKAAVLPLSRADGPERDGAPTLRPLKKKTSGSHLWRLSSPPAKAPLLLLDRATCLQKSHSAQNLSSDCTFHRHFVDLLLYICWHFCNICQIILTSGPLSEHCETAKLPQECI